MKDENTNDDARHEGVHNTINTFNENSYKQ